MDVSTVIRLLLVGLYGQWPIYSGFTHWKWGCSIVYRWFMTVWWFGTSFFLYILGIVTPTDLYFSEGLKPPTSIRWLLASRCRRRKRPRLEPQLVTFNAAISSCQPLWHWSRMGTAGWFLGPTNLVMWYTISYGCIMIYKKNIVDLWFI